ncbi:JmjC domain, hydroxylase-domain-containing protein, partial [Scheffersomyces xylosifermentans]|uniref:JmjC domain, hydroxylase-domain-containing protein n=1 Tax=Scheffersomyces xylosifermentans TaxID=1304137 RepID=UPI00315DEB41
APDLFKRQPDLLHQLVTLLSPMKLIENGIRCVYADQNPNEFVITYPKVYHSGFNSGFNFNEAVNFTMNCWLEYGERSINDYKLIGKENVFNHFQLIENILKSFNKQRGSINSTQIDLVKRSLECFERFVSEQNDFLSTLDKSKFKQEYKPKKYKPRKFEDEQVGAFDESEAKNEEEEDLCDVCKTHLSYQYCVINNKTHRFQVEEPSTPPPDIPLVEKPRVIEHSITVKQEPIKRITIQQLLTPDSSPYDTQPYSEARVNLDQMANLESSKKMAQLSESKDSQNEEVDSDEEADEKAKNCMMAQYDQLISAAKRSASAEVQENKGEGDRKRRKSRRLQELPEKAAVKEEPEDFPRVPTTKHRGQKMTGKMTAVQHKSHMKQLNEKSAIRLCLQCCLKNYGTSCNGIPEGSILLFEAYPSQLKEIIKATKRNLSELSL